MLIICNFYYIKPTLYGRIYHTEIASLTVLMPYIFPHILVRVKPYFSITILSIPRYTYVEVVFMDYADKYEKYEYYRDMLWVDISACVAI